MRILALALMLCISSLASAVTVNKVVVFGDSLSDNGNLFEYMKHQLPMDPPYYKGRFSNGRVWIELLTEKYFPHQAANRLLDYAYAGAAVINEEDDTLFTLRNEVNSFLLSHQGKADPNNLYVVWIGANNYLAIPEDAEKTVNEVNQGIKDSLEQLINNGGKTFLILNMPDLGRTPVAREFDAEAALTNMSLQHNAMLAKNIESLQKSNPAVQLVYFDVKSALDEMFAYPAQFGFTNVTDTCYESSVQEPSLRTAVSVAALLKTKAISAACDGFLFFDPVHPTALAHHILSDRTDLILKNAGVSFE